MVLLPTSRGSCACLGFCGPVLEYLGRHTVIVLSFCAKNICQLDSRYAITLDFRTYYVNHLLSFPPPRNLVENKQGRQFLSRSWGDESRDWPSFADFSLALSYIILKCKVWTPRRGGDGPSACPRSIQIESDISGPHTFTANCNLNVRAIWKTIMFIPMVYNKLNKLNHENQWKSIKK